MKRVSALVLVLLLMCGCAAFKANAISGKTDATVAYYEKWLVGAQAYVACLGGYAPIAEAAIGAAYVALAAYKATSDMYAASVLDKNIEVVKVVANQAGDSCQWPT